MDSMILGFQMLCIRDAKCQKEFPKIWCDQTVLTEGSFLERARSWNSQIWGNYNFGFNNRWAVPYNAFLFKKYRTHINIEVAKVVHVVKYLAKYVYKGINRATLVIVDRFDEILMTLQAQHIRGMKAHHYLMKYPTHFEKPAVMMLLFNLESRHWLVFAANFTMQQLAAAAKSYSSAFLY